jgi:hypothetical protein
MNHVHQFFQYRTVTFNALWLFIPGALIAAFAVWAVLEIKWLRSREWYLEKRLREVIDGFRMSGDDDDDFDNGHTPANGTSGILEARPATPEEQAEFRAQLLRLPEDVRALRAKLLEQIDQNQALHARVRSAELSEDHARDFMRTHHEEVGKFIGAMRRRTL